MARLAGRLAGYLLALTAGAAWGTTGPLSTALYAEGAAITGIGLWRILLATLGLIVYGPPPSRRPSSPSSVRSSHSCFSTSDSPPSGGSA